MDILFHPNFHPLGTAVIAFHGNAALGGIGANAALGRPADIFFLMGDVAPTKSNAEDFLILLE
jgi:hypothetical protein